MCKHATGLNKEAYIPYTYILFYNLIASHQTLRNTQSTKALVLCSGTDDFPCCLNAELSIVSFTAPLFQRERDTARSHATVIIHSSPHH